MAATKECGEHKDLTTLEKQIGDLCGVPVRPQTSDFEVLEQLGEGNFSTIVKCKLKATGKIYAVKMIEKIITVAIGCTMIHNPPSTDC